MWLRENCLTFSILSVPGSCMHLICVCDYVIKEPTEEINDYGATVFAERFFSYMKEWEKCCL